MSKIDELSMESILNSLFSTEEDGEAVDAEGEKKEEEEKVQFIITLDPEVVEQLTEEEKDTVYISPDEEQVVVVDESEAAEESARLSAEAATLQLALQTAEEFIWSPLYSTEGDLSDAAKAAFKKFVEWLKKIVAKIREFLLSVVRRVQIFLAGDMKAISKWAQANKADIESAISAKGDEVKLMIKKPITNIFGSNNEVEAQIKKFETMYASGQSTKITDEEIVKIEELLKDDVSNIKEIFYGKDPKREEVTLKSYNEVMKITSVLNSGSYVKAIAGVLPFFMKASNSMTKVMDQASNDPQLTQEELARIKKYGVLSNKFFSKTINIIYWYIGDAIANIKIAKTFAARALAANAKKEEPAK